MNTREKVALWFAGLASTPEAANGWPCGDVDATFGVKTFGSGKAAKLYQAACHYANVQFPYDHEFPYDHDYDSAFWAECEAAIRNGDV